MQRHQEAQGPQVAALVAHTRAAARLGGAVVGVASLGWLCSVLESGAEEGGHFSALDLASPALFFLGLYALGVCCACSAMRQSRHSRAHEAARQGGFQMPGVRTPRDEHEPLVPVSPCVSPGRSRTAAPPNTTFAAAPPADAQSRSRSAPG